MSDLAIYRDRFFVPATGVVSIVIEVPTDKEEAKKYATLAGFVCVTCSEPLKWIEARKIMECPTCGYELTAREGISLCDFYFAEIDKLSTLLGKQRQKKRGLIWRFLRWFGGAKNR
jgi:predicted RNA-binding Zn-ribbon protein involved in translation (DUF1610 family)